MPVELTGIGIDTPVSSTGIMGPIHVGRQSDLL